MAIWKVVAAPIKFFPHPNSDTLRIGKIGPYQVVVNQDCEAVDGDVVVFAPERAILPEDLRPEYVNSQTGVSYLAGPAHDRVQSVRLRKELSQGAILPMSWVRARLGADIPVNVDLSERLGITKYIPEIPPELMGSIERMPEIPHFSLHDVEQSAIYADEFIEGEDVIMTEKVHGIQVSILRTPDGKVYVTSKGHAENGFTMAEESDNKYWKAVRNSGLLKWLSCYEWVKNCTFQFWGEVIPAQRGKWSYGQTEPTLRLYRFDVNSQTLPLEDIRRAGYVHLQAIWVPIVYEGPYSVEVLKYHAKGMEMVSGKQLHIREGGVVSPKVPRNSSEGWPLYVKFINPKFEGTDDDLS